MQDAPHLRTIVIDDHTALNFALEHDGHTFLIAFTPKEAIEDDAQFLKALFALMRWNSNSAIPLGQKEASDMATVMRLVKHTPHLWK